MLYIIGHWRYILFYFVVHQKKTNLNNTLSQINTGGKIMSEHLTKETFQKKIFDFEKNEEWKFEGDLPCVIDFYADWCGPCKMVAPIIDELSKEYEGKVNFYKIDTEQEAELSSMFGIKSIPTILFVPLEGQPKASMGALPKEQFMKIIDNELIESAQETA